MVIVTIPKSSNAIIFIPEMFAIYLILAWNLKRSVSELNGQQKKISLALPASTFWLTLFNRFFAWYIYTPPFPSNVLFSQRFYNGGKK